MSVCVKIVKFFTFLPPSYWYCILYIYIHTELSKSYSFQIMFFRPFTECRKYEYIKTSIVYSLALNLFIIRFKKITKTLKVTG